MDYRKINKLHYDNREFAVTTVRTPAPFSFDRHVFTLAIESIAATAKELVMLAASIDCCVAADYDDDGCVIALRTAVPRHRDCERVVLYSLATLIQAEQILQQIVSERLGPFSRN